MTDIIDPDRLAQFKATIAERHQMNESDASLIIDNALNYDETGKALVFALALIDQNVSVDAVKMALATTRLAASRRGLDDFLRRAKV
jgi:hypothetical protein